MRHALRTLWLEAQDYASLRASEPPPAGRAGSGRLMLMHANDSKDGWPKSAIPILPVTIGADGAAFSNSVTTMPSHVMRGMVNFVTQ